MRQVLSSLLFYRWRNGGTKKDKSKVTPPISDETEISIQAVWLQRSTLKHHAYCLLTSYQFFKSHNWLEITFPIVTSLFSYSVYTVSPRKFLFSTLVNAYTFAFQLWLPRALDSLCVLWRLGSPWKTPSPLNGSWRSLKQCGESCSSPLTRHPVSPCPAGLRKQKDEAGWQTE